MPNTLVEIWQCNAAGRYIHEVDQHPAPLDPNFTGAGRVVTDADGHYQFITIKPGAYPWRNHHNAWRPAHIHLSLFGPSFLTRLVTQMYFPGDPLFPFDPIFNSVTDAKARERMICQLRPGRRPSPNGRSATSSTSCCAGRNATPLGYRPCLSARPPRPSARTCTSAWCRAPTACARSSAPVVADAGMPGTHIRIEGRVLDGDGNVAARRAWSRSGRPTPRAATRIRPTAGRSTSNSFRGFGRCATDKDGGFRFDTIKPGPVPGPGGTLQAPHINVGMFARGILKRLFTRIYFAGEPANATDPILALVPADRRDTLHGQARPGQARPLPLRHPPAGRRRDGVLRRVGALSPLSPLKSAERGQGEGQHWLRR